MKGVTPDIVYPSFSDTMDIGEEKLPHAMAWDTIQPLNYNVFDPNLSALIPVLKERSEQRIRNNPEFTLLKKDIEAFRKIRDRKTVSLNLEKRWQEYLSHLARSINLLHLIYDQDFILGGYLAPYLQEKDLSYIHEEIRRMTPFPENQDFLHISKMPKHNITIGAALPYIQEFLNM